MSLGLTLSLDKPSPDLVKPWLNLHQSICLGEDLDWNSVQQYQLLIYVIDMKLGNGAFFPYVPLAFKQMFQEKQCKGINNLWAGRDLMKYALGKKRSLKHVCLNRSCGFITIPLRQQLKLVLFNSSVGQGEYIVDYCWEWWWQFACLFPLNPKDLTMKTVRKQNPLWRASDRGGKSWVERLKEFLVWANSDQGAWKLLPTWG